MALISVHATHRSIEMSVEMSVETSVETALVRTRARLYGWTNADELQAFQYDTDVADSAHGMGAGLEWCAGRCVLFGGHVD
jgi:hypothetical protein